MKPVRLLALLLGGALLATASLPASADPSESVRISAFADFSGPTSVYGWAATGAISDGGPWIDEGFHWAAIPSPVVGTLHQRIAFVGARGTLHVQGDGPLRVAGPGVLLMEGSWRVLSGEGAYAAAVGQGTFTITFYASRAIPDVAVFEGRIHFDRRGG